jgi:hypothetical protein
MNRHALLAALATIVLSSSPSTLFAQVLRYTFDEASGNALDTGTAPATDATFEGGAARSADTPSGSGFSLDMRTEGAAPGAFLLGGDFADIDGLAALTLTTWLKVETYPSGNKRLLAKQGGGTFPGFSFNMNATTNDTLPAGPDHFRLGFFAGDGVGFSSGFSDADTGAADWTFFAVSFDTALGEMTFYAGDVDTPVAQLGSTIFAAPLAAPVDGLDARFAVGLTDAAPAADTSVTGLQDDVRVYGSVLDLAALEAVRMENIGSGGPDFDADFDGDDDVDGDDFDDWTTGFGLATGATKSQGDANGDMDVDGGDFLVWQNEVGSGVMASVVPEPTAGLLALAPVVLHGVRRRRAFAQPLVAPAHS